jgi:hypothetical protein
MFAVIVQYDMISDITIGIRILIYFACYYLERYCYNQEFVRRQAGYSATYN